MKAIIVTFLTFLLSACPNNNRRLGWNNSQIAPNNQGFNNQLQNIRVSNNTDMCNPGNWGGVSCVSGSNRDKGFRDFLSSGMDVYRDEDVVGDISCQPSNTGGANANAEGFLMRLSIELNGAFDAFGSNQLTVQPTSYIQFKIIDREIPGAEKPSPDININQIRATRGEVNGNRVTIHFADEKGTLDLEGTFDANTFRGVIRFKNNAYWDNAGDGGAEGVLGNFEINTCLAFRSR